MYSVQPYKDISKTWERIVWVGYIIYNRAVLSGSDGRKAALQ